MNEIDKNIRLADKRDFPAVLSVWEASVLKTHDFLHEADRKAIYQGLRDSWLEMLTLLEVWEERGRILAFLGMNPPQVEMLFVHPAAMGKKIGTRLLDHARARFGRLTVDVNEQNSAARQFYLRYGFKETGRFPLDGQGRPYPLIHMQLQPQPGDH